MDREKYRERPFSWPVTGDSNLASPLSMSAFSLCLGHSTWQCQSNRLANASSARYELLEQQPLNNKGVIIRGKEELFACPICFEPLTRKGPQGLNQIVISKSGFQCQKCSRTYSRRESYLDLTLTSGATVYQESQEIGTEMFRNPLVSFAYERGWRQSFVQSGFPGPDEELKMALQFLKPSFGGILVDVSCGSGLFTRRFAKSGNYAAVVALDFSENMLRQCFEFIKQDKSLETSEISLIRADVSRLPFASSTIDAVHAGAALHCWPSPSLGVAEISRVLKPGGIFVATTFLGSTNYMAQFLPLLRSEGLVRPIRYWSDGELEELCRICGLVSYKQIQKQGFIMICAKKKGST